MKYKTSLVAPTLKLSLLVAGVCSLLIACSDDTQGTDEVVDSTMTTSTMTATNTASMSATSAMSSSMTSSMTSTSTVTSSVTSTSATASTTGSGGATSTAAGGMTSAGGASTSSTAAGGTGAGGTATTAGEDLDMTAEQFSCIADWTQVLGFRITNLLGHEEEAIAVANNPNGGVYPVGTIIQHLPTEAMVKRATGFSPATRDWEFFILQLGQDGTTTIQERGTTEITTMGNTCASCHSMVPAEFDFICNTWAPDGGMPNCGFNFTDMQLENALSMDTRCN